MVGPNRTQKDLARSYRGNLDYLRKFHFLRRLRLVVFVVFVLGSIGIALAYRQFGRSGGPKEFFSTGPISANHAKFAHRCEVCHDGADADLAKALHPSELAKLAKLTPGDAPKLWSGLKTDMGTLEKYDAACVKCHAPYQLHQPAATALMLREFYSEIGLVHAGSCSTCHKEHDGPEKMKLPPSDNCRSCHNDPARLAKDLTLMKATASLVSQHGEVRTFKFGASNNEFGRQNDGVRRFIPPRKTPHQPVAFASFATEHPNFGYEQPNLVDPAEIKYGHLRHRQPDVVANNGGRHIDCITCHKLGADGVFMQRNDYNSDCRRCHALIFDPAVPEMELPHGHPQGIRDFLNRLGAEYQAAGIKQGIPASEMATFVTGRVEALGKQLGFTAGSDPNLAKIALERRIFYLGDPSGTKRLTTKSNATQSFFACTKCHTVPEKPPGILPVVAPTNIPDRWLTRGPYTHTPHLHMQCIDCHPAALASEKTSDILLPGREYCAKCHRPLEHKPQDPAVPVRPFTDKNAELVTQQINEGGIVAECQGCHGKFHAPSGAAVYARQVK